MAVTVVLILVIGMGGEGVIWDQGRVLEGGEVRIGGIIALEGGFHCARIEMVRFVGVRKERFWLCRIAPGFRRDYVEKGSGGRARGGYPKKRGTEMRRG